MAQHGFVGRQKVGRKPLAGKFYKLKLSLPDYSFLAEIAYLEHEGNMAETIRAIIRTYRLMRLKFTLPDLRPRK